MGAAAALIVVLAVPLLYHPLTDRSADHVQVGECVTDVSRTRGHHDYRMADCDGRGTILRVVKVVDKPRDRSLSECRGVSATTYVWLANTSGTQARLLCVVYA
jgi:hypothetical protein